MSSAQGVVGRARAASVKAVNKAFVEFDPQPGVWAGVGTSIAHAPNLSELRSPGNDGERIEFDVNGVNVRKSNAPEIRKQREAKHNHGLRHNQYHQHADIPEDESSANTTGNGPTDDTSSQAEIVKPKKGKFADRPYNQDPWKAPQQPWSTTLKHGSRAFLKFVLTPTGFLLTLYSLNVVAWGAMLFFLELHAAHSMQKINDGNDNDSPRKIWLEIDSQILNALFCVTAWGLAPWRFRDAWWLLKWRLNLRGKVNGEKAFRRLAKRNEAWFRPNEAAHDIDIATDRVEIPEKLRNGDHAHRIAAVALHDFRAPALEQLTERITFTGRHAPPTHPQMKLDAAVWLYVANSLLQCGMAFFMLNWYGFTKHHGLGGFYYERPSWGTGTFIGLGCFSAMLAGILSWWEGRKVKRIEGPTIKVEDEPKTASGDIRKPVEDVVQRSHSFRPA